jgi:hypothetical protein
MSRFYLSSSVFLVALIMAIAALSVSDPYAIQYSRAAENIVSSSTQTVAEHVEPIAPKPTLDTHAYDLKMIAIANYPVKASSTATSSTSASSTTTHLWPTKAPYPLPGAILPFHRIIAYYGNFYSTKMGILGQNPPSIMIPQLQAEVAKWNAADPSTPALPAIDYIVVTAQGSAGADGKYRARMPDSQVQKAIDLAAQVHGIVILDVQVGLSNVQTEIPLLKQYLMLPQVHLALDPEFSMKTGAKPGTVIGSMDATDVNFAANYLATLVQENNLPPKVLIVHRFTQGMVTHTSSIHPLPEVQIIMDMDGWGSPAKKLNTYAQFIQLQPVQFTGFKLFYKNDLKAPSTRMLTYPELLKLSPRPLFIQYQ